MNDFRAAIEDRLEDFLIVLQAEMEDPAGAVQVYRQAIRSLNPLQASLATLRLGHLLSYIGDVPGAAEAYQEAANSPQAEIAAEAALRLGNLLYENGDLEGAISAYRRAAASGHSEFAPEGAIRLGNTLFEAGQNQAAAAAYEQAAGFEHPRWHDLAERSLSRMRETLPTGHHHEPLGESTGAAKSVSPYRVQRFEAGAGGVFVIVEPPGKSAREEPETDESGTQEILVEAYLDTDSLGVAGKVFDALDELVEALGFEDTLALDLIKGSWFRRTRSAAKQALTSDEFRSCLGKAERAVELMYLERHQADVDSKEAQAASQLIAALQSVPQACIRVGSILLIKFDAQSGPTLVMRNLSVSELKALERFPEIQKHPSKTLEALATAIAILEPSSEQSPADDIS